MKLFSQDRTFAPPSTIPPFLSFLLMFSLLWPIAGNLISIVIHGQTYFLYVIAPTRLLADINALVSLSGIFASIFALRLTWRTNTKLTHFSIILLLLNTLIFLAQTLLVLY